MILNTSWKRRLSATLIALGGLAMVGFGGCNGSPTSGNSAGGCSAGTTYAGGGPAAFTIAFSQSSGSICGLSGKVFVACASLAGSADHYWTYSDPNTIAENSDGSFSDRYTLGSGTATVTGHIDGSGTAHGTFLFQETSCSSDTINWQVPYSAASATATAGTAACSPQPCGSIGGFTAAVSGVKNGTAADGEGVWIVEATVTNQTSATATFAANQFALRAGSPTSPSELDTAIASATDDQGNMVQCSQGSTSVDPGQSTDVNACFGSGNAPSGTPLTLIFSSSFGGASVDIDIGPSP